MDWGALAQHAAAVRSARRGRESRAEGARVLLDLGQARRYRLVSGHLNERLRTGEFDLAAFGGLQDSSPRSALISLHARMHDVGPDDWEAPALAQVWLRWADYVVPHSAVGAFTLGALPRDPHQRRALIELADAVLAVLDGRRLRPREVAAAIPGLPNEHFLRSLCLTGKVHIRWDASTTVLVPAEPVAIDEEQARLELARRFLHWLGPANQAQFSRWAGVAAADAYATWRALAAELLPVSLDGRARWALASDEAALTGAGTPVINGVRMLPAGDPYLSLDHGFVVADPPARLEERSPGGVTRRVLNSLTGRVVVDGEIVGSWGRTGGRVTVAPWPEMAGPDRDRISAEIETLNRPMARRIHTSWVD